MIKPLVPKPEVTPIDTDVPFRPHYYRPRYSLPKYSKSIDAIDIIQAYDLDWELGSAMKYILRSGKKEDNAELDITKAMEFLQRWLLHPKRKK